jgi:hypothetical protein
VRKNSVRGRGQVESLKVPNGLAPRYDRPPELSVAFARPLPRRRVARPLRLEFPGALWHVTNRGVEQRAIYADDRDRRREP